MTGNKSEISVHMETGTLYKKYQLLFYIFPLRHATEIM